jgi:hypothetical protein
MTQLSRYALSFLVLCCFVSASHAMAATSSSQSLQFQLTIRPQVGVSCPNSTALTSRASNVTCRIEQTMPRGVLAVTSLQDLPASSEATVPELLPVAVKRTASLSSLHTLEQTDSTVSFQALPSRSSQLQKPLSPEVSQHTLFFAFI